MKKKILYLGIAIMMVIALLVLTGCGVQKTEEDKSEGDASGETSQTEKTEEEKEEISVDDVCASSQNYAVVLGKDKNVYIIDGEGNATGSLDISYNDENDVLRINSNGYIYYYSTSESFIADKTGEKIYESSSTVKYRYVTSDDTTLRITTSSDFDNGSTTTREMIDMKGNVISQFEEENKTYMGGHIWYFGSSYDSYLTLYSDETNATNEIKFSYKSDMNLNNIIETSNGSVVQIGKSWIIDKELNISELSGIAINSEYYYNTDDNSFYGYDGTKIQEISSGNGLQSDKNYIYNYNNTWSVLSTTKYLYSMNESFETIVEPFQLELTNIGVVGNKCVIVGENADFNSKGYSGTWKHYYIYDFEKNLVADLDEGWQSISSENFIAVLKPSQKGDVNGGVTYFSSYTSEGYANLNTGTSLVIYK